MISNEAREASWPHRPARYSKATKTQWMWGLYDHLPMVQAFQSVIDAERERCARIADHGYVGLSPELDWVALVQFGYSYGCRDAAKAIAAAIRGADNEF
jgi:hypothetical protein